MNSASQLLWMTVLGEPAQADCLPVADVFGCWVCGSNWQGRGALVAKWMPGSFTSQNRVRLPKSQWVCEPCVHICSRLSPVLGRPPKEGKLQGGNYRNYSHAWWQKPDGSVEYINASKGEKPALLAWLRKPKQGTWWCAVADSGQKHVIPWAPVCRTAKSGSVLLDDALITLGSWQLVDDMAELLTVGATKDEITTGDYHAGSIMRCGADIEAFEKKWSGQRGGAFFGLAIWLAQRDEERVAARLAAEKEAKKNGRQKKSDGQAVGLFAHAVPTNAVMQPDEALGAAGDSKSSSLEDECQPARVADHDVSQPADRRAGQLDLFGSLGFAESAAKPKRRR